MNLPIELLHGIFIEVPVHNSWAGIRDRRDWKTLRLVCRHFREAATDLVFDQIIVSPNPRSIEKATEMMGYFPFTVQEIVILPTPHKCIMMDEVVDVIEEMEYRRHYDDTDITEQDIFDAEEYLKHDVMETYNELVNTCQESVKSGRFGAFLSTSLLTLPNVRRLILENYPRLQRLNEVSSIRLLSLGFQQSSIPEPPRACHSTSKLKEQWPHLKGLPEWSSCPLGNLWIPLMEALAQSSYPLQEIDMGFPDRIGQRVATPFDAPPNVPITALRHLPSSIFTDLTKLRLHLDVPKEKDPSIENQIASVMSSLGYLNKLILHGAEEAPLASGSMFRHCNFPQLQLLNLQRFEATKSDVCQLMRASPHLKSLALQDLSLLSGSWEQVVECIWGTLDLKAIYILSPKQHDQVGLEFRYAESRLGSHVINRSENPFKDASIWGKVHYVLW